MTLLEQAQLPHNTPRKRFQLERQAGHMLLEPLGSLDYFAIGEVYGGGNARTNLSGLEQAMCKRAAEVGGDVILVFRAGVQQRPFSVTTPGYAHTTAYGSAYRTGNYVYGSANARTTYTPGHTISGVHHLPYANAMVFRHVPGIEQKRMQLELLDDDALKSVMDELSRICCDSALTFNQMLEQWDKLACAETVGNRRTATQAAPVPQ